MDRFRGHQTEQERMHELLQREQQPGKSADDYIHSMQQLPLRLKKPMPERQLVKVVKKGLRDGIARDVYAMDELRHASCLTESPKGKGALQDEEIQTTRGSGCRVECVLG